MIPLSQRARDLPASVTLSLSAKAKAMRAAGRPVISFATGEPDFVSPPAVLDAARAAIAEGRTHYAPVPGLAELRAAIAEDFASASGVPCAAEEVLVSNGAKQCLSHILMAILDPGDRLLVPTPYWVSYPSMARLAEAEMVVFETRAADGFAIDLERLRAAFDQHKPKAMLLNSPQNPSGVVYEPEAIAAIVEEAVARNIAVVSDEIYSDLVYDGAVHRCALSVDDPRHRAQVIVVDGVSKRLAMTGWRVGYARGPVEVIKAASRIQSHTTSGACTISQLAALGGLRGPRQDFEAMLAAFAERRKTMVTMLRAIPGLELVEPRGAFFTLPEARRYCRGSLDGRPVHNDAELADVLLETAEIAVSPGSAFGAPGFLRLSFALGMEPLVEGLERLARAFERWEDAP